ncbi:MAG TPA: transcription termination/antitermination NusG family protein [Pontiellaceae bacterium]|nr:transcription termination/antitermination NusG family protein [Pontiellaceae bacterium]
MEQTPASSENFWLCVRAQPKREHIAAGRLKLLAGVEVFCPRIRFQRNTKRGKVWFEEALFPGYLFARFDVRAMLRTVSGTYGVQGLVRFAGECAQVPDFVVDSLRREASGVIVVKEPALKPGDTAIMAEGAMRGLRAVVTQVLPGGERVKILMELMGTSVAAEVSIMALEPAA